MLCVLSATKLADNSAIALKVYYSSNHCHCSGSADPYLNFADMYRVLLMLFDCPLGTYLVVTHARAT